MMKNTCDITFVDIVYVNEALSHYLPSLSTKIVLVCSLWHTTLGLGISDSFKGPETSSLTVDAAGVPILCNPLLQSWGLPAALFTQLQIIK
jgi:hypothetical protein